MKNILCFCLIIFAVSISLPAQAVEKTCAYCHAEHMGTTMTLLKKDINELCSSCHTERLKKGEHRVGMSPPMTVRELPLQGGKMTCATCHNPHAKTPSMLWKTTRDLCISCHDK